MPSLRELQRDFANGVLDGDTAVHESIAPGGLSAERRLQVYRNNCFLSLGESLAGIYPVVERLVGVDYFRWLARQYVVAFPSTAGDLHAFGGALAQLLERRPELEAHPYVADVARLEWAMFVAYHAADAEALDPTALAQVPTDRQASLSLRLHPSVRLLSSPYPVASIWAANQPGQDGSVDLKRGGEEVLVMRSAGGVQYRRLSPAAHALLQAFEREATLEGAVAAAEVAAASDGEVEAAVAGIGSLVAEGVVVGWVLAPTDPENPHTEIN